MRPAGLLQASLDRVLPTKLRPPQLRDQRVTRWRLLAQLDATQSKAVLVVAPAGFGKTTLLVQWASESANSVAWISLGPKDNALARFLAYVVAALSGVDPELPEYVRQHLIQTEESGPSALADAVLHAVERSRQPWSLVFDDFHAISDPAIHDFIAALIDVLPAGCRLIVLSRSEPQFKVARLQMLDDLIVLTENDLRATEDECIALLSQNGIDPSGTDLAALVEHTTGWLVAIHCIALACRNESVDRVIAAIATRDNKLDMLHAYLFEEVLGRESPELRAFLLRIAILDRFTVDACFAVTGSTSAGQLIKWTRRSGFFLVGLDEGGAWFRFHHLFREFLLRQLQIDVDPRSIRELYAAASHWFEQHNLIEEAISYAVRAEDWPKATAMITSVAAELLTSDRLVGLWEWVHSFPSDVIFADPNLSSITGYALIRQGRVSEAEPYIAAVEACWQA
jgi:LuxR family maltose regulon positive regulatory protein